MKKYMIGFIAGALFMIAGQSFAGSTSLIGKKIDSEVPITIDGKVVDKAIVIQGKSFAPVRSVTVAMGGEVSSVSKGGIALKTGIDLSNVDDRVYKLKVLNTAKTTLETEIQELKKLLAGLEADLLQAKADVEYSQKNSPDSVPAYQRNVDQRTAEIKTRNDKIAELQAKIDDINTQITEVEAGTTTPTPTPEPTPSPIG